METELSPEETARVERRPTEAREHLVQVEDRFGRGLLHAARGETDAAFPAWSDVEERGLTSSGGLRYWYPDVLDPLRDDPHYRELIQRMNQQWGLHPDGSLPDGVDVSFDLPRSDA